jgi:hypothetical protein
VKAGDPLALLELLRSEDCDVQLQDGRLELRPSQRWARLASRASWQLLTAVLIGAKTGHVWARCDTCGEGTMRPKSAGPKRCVMTPRCSGSHRP